VSFDEQDLKILESDTLPFGRRPGDIFLLAEETAYGIGFPGGRQDAQMLALHVLCRLFPVDGSHRVFFFTAVA
jgi:hypothetical protein